MMQESDSEVSESDSSRTRGNLFTVNGENTPTCIITVGSNNCRVLIDSGADDNVIDEATYNSWEVKPKLIAPTIKLYSYNSNEPLPVIGEFNSVVYGNDKQCSGVFLVIRGRSGCLLSCDTSRRLGLFQTQAFSEINNVKNSNEDYKELFREFKSVFNDTIGCLKGYEVELHVDETIKPKQQPYRRIAHHLIQPVEKELQKLLKNDIIEKVSEPSEWVSAIVVVPKPKKPGEVRITIDSRLANKAIKRTRYVVPTTEQIAYDMNGAKVFSRLDCNKAFHQVRLKKKSRPITTFITHKGRFRFKRLHMGVNVASEEFQKALGEALEGLEGVKNLADDIVVFGRNRKEHDKRLRELCLRLEEKGITCSPDNCEIGVSELT